MKTLRITTVCAAIFTLASFGSYAQTSPPSQPLSPGEQETANTPPDTRQTPPAGPNSSQVQPTGPEAHQMTPNAPTPGQESMLNSDDHKFMENALQSSHAEIEGNELALEKTENADVQQFAQMMIDDHRKMLDEAMKLATDKGMTPPDGPSIMQTTEITALKALTGNAFDTMYVNRIGVAAHESAIELFEEAEKTAEDPEVKALISKTLPKLREHLQMAQALDEKQDRE